MWKETACKSVGNNEMWILTGDFSWNAMLDSLNHSWMTLILLFIILVLIWRNHHFFQITYFSRPDNIQALYNYKKKKKTLQELRILKSGYAAMSYDSELQQKDDRFICLL